MTDYEIIRIMRWTTETSQIDSLVRRIRVVVDKAVRQEREECAKVCEGFEGPHRYVDDIAEAIRKRGENE